MIFRWIDWNLHHIPEHGVTPREVEDVVNQPVGPYPESIGHDKFMVRGQTSAGEYIQTIYIFSPAGVVFVIHARPLTDREKKAFRRRRKK